MNKTDVQLQAITLDQAKQRIAEGWRLGYDRGPRGLEVWLKGPGQWEYEYCEPRDFPHLAAYERCAERARAAAQTKHLLVIGSNCVYSYGYDESLKVFEIRFKKDGRRGDLYRYRGVPQDVVEGFELAKVRGAFYRSHIAGKYECERIEERTPLGAEGFKATLDDLERKANMDGAVADTGDQPWGER